MSMFTNYDNLPSSYIPDNLSPREAPERYYAIKLPYVVYNAKDEAIGYKWSYGDTVELNFTISGNVIYDLIGGRPYDESISTYMSTGDQRICFRIYNNRFESIYVAYPRFICMEDGTVDVKIFIYDELAKVLVKGEYSLYLAIEGTQINPIYVEGGEQPEMLNIRQTIVKPENCPVYIV